MLLQIIHFILLWLASSCEGFGQFHMKQYTPSVDSSESDNTVLSIINRIFNNINLLIIYIYIIMFIKPSLIIE